MSVTQLTHTSPAAKAIQHTFQPGSALHQTVCLSARVLHKPQTRILGFCFLIARSDLWKVLFWAPSVWVFCLCMKYLEGGVGTAERICAKFTWKTCLVPHSEKFEGQGHQGQKWHFSAACMQFMFAKTSLACSFLWSHSQFGRGAQRERQGITAAGFVPAECPVMSSNNKMSTE